MVIFLNVAKPTEHLYLFFCKCKRNKENFTDQIYGATEFQKQIKSWSHDKDVLCHL